MNYKLKNRNLWAAATTKIDVAEYNFSYQNIHYKQVQQRMKGNNNFQKKTK